MIQTIAVTPKNEIVTDVPLERIKNPYYSWYWVDFNQPDDSEIHLLKDYFHFHHLAIEDCLHFLQRPKLDHYENESFLVLHSLHPQNNTTEELDMFIGSNFIVTFHLKPLYEIQEVVKKISNLASLAENSHSYLSYLIIDKLVDYYFPAVYQIEDELLNLTNEKYAGDMDKIFAIRRRLLKLRKTIVPMGDLLYQLLNTRKVEGFRIHREYFSDIYDHLLKLSEIIETNRDISSDLRDSYISIISNRMNNIMKTLTVITTIFMPLTFIAGIYGMNFEYMPELKWTFGYFIVLGLMVLIGVGMFFWFYKKGWFK